MPLNVPGGACQTLSELNKKSTSRKQLCPTWTQFAHTSASGFTAASSKSAQKLMCLSRSLDVEASCPCRCRHAPTDHQRHMLQLHLKVTHLFSQSLQVHFPCRSRVLSCRCRVLVRLCSLIFGHFLPIFLPVYVPTLLRKDIQASVTSHDHRYPEKRARSASLESARLSGAMSVAFHLGQERSGWICRQHVLYHSKASCMVFKSPRHVLVAISGLARSPCVA